MAVLSLVMAEDLQNLSAPTLHEGVALDQWL